MNFRLLAIITLLSSISFIGFGQGMAVYAGSSSMKTQLPSLTTDGHAHTGYHVGADGRLGDDSFYFTVGLQYHKLDFNATPDFSFNVTDPSFGILKGKGGLAFKIFEVNKQIVTRIRLMGALDYLLNTPESGTVDNPSNLVFNEGVAGAIGGLEIDIYFLTLNFEYQKGFFRSVKETDDSSMDFITMSLGVNF